MQILQSEKGFRMLKCTIMNRFTESFGNSNSAYFEGWVISAAYCRVLISQFESAMQPCSKGVLQGGTEMQLRHIPKFGGVVPGLPVQM